MRVSQSHYVMLFGIGNIMLGGGWNHDTPHSIYLKLSFKFERPPFAPTTFEVIKGFVFF